MTDKVAEWKPEDAVNAVRDRIRAEFVSLIPAETFTQMVIAEINKFTQEESRNSSGYSYRTSSFRETVIDVLRESTREEVKKLLAQPEWREYWDGGAQTASKMVKEILAENGEQIIRQFLANLLGQAMQSTTSSMLSQMPRY